MFIHRAQFSVAVIG